MSHMKAAMVERDPKDIEADGFYSVDMHPAQPVCPVCRDTGSVEDPYWGPGASCPNCTREDHLAPQQYP